MVTAGLLEDGRRRGFITAALSTELRGFARRVAPPGYGAPRAELSRACCVCEIFLAVHDLGTESALPAPKGPALRLQHGRRPELAKRGLRTRRFFGDRRCADGADAQRVVG